jgi:integrase
LFTNKRALAEQEMLRHMGEVERAYQGRGNPPKATYGEAHGKRFEKTTHSAATIRDGLWWLDALGATRLCETIDWELVLGLAAKALRPGYTDGTLKRKVVEVRATLTFAHQHFGAKRGCAAPNFPPLADGKPRSIYLRPEDCAAMLRLLVNEGNQIVAEVFCVALGEGPRRRELFKMAFSRVDLENEIIDLRDTKSLADEERDRIISDPRPSTMACLWAIWRRRTGKSDAVFNRPDGTPFSSEHAFGNFVNPHLKRVAREAGVPDWQRITLHVARHTAATNHYLLTADIYEVQTRFDWYLDESAKRYIKKAPKQLAPQVAELYGLAGIWHSPHALLRPATGKEPYLLGEMPFFEGPAAPPRLPLVGTAGGFRHQGAPGGTARRPRQRPAWFPRSPPGAKPSGTPPPERPPAPRPRREARDGRGRGRRS